MIAVAGIGEAVNDASGDVDDSLVRYAGLRVAQLVGLQIVAQDRVRHLGGEQHRVGADDPLDRARIEDRDLGYPHFSYQRQLFRKLDAILGDPRQLMGEVKRRRD